MAGRHGAERGTSGSSQARTALFGSIYMLFNRSWLVTMQDAKQSARLGEAGMSERKRRRTKVVQESEKKAKRKKEGEKKKIDVF